MAKKRSMNTITVDKLGKPLGMSENSDSYLRAIIASFEDELLVVDKDYRIVQGHLERSNVDSMKEMVKMMELVRNHGSYTKLIKSFDDLEEKTIQQLGRL